MPKDEEPKIIPFPKLTQHIDQTRRRRTENPLMTELRESVKAGMKDSRESIFEKLEALVEDVLIEAEDAARAISEGKEIDIKAFSLNIAARLRQIYDQVYFLK